LQKLNASFYQGLFLVVFALFFIAVTPSQIDLYEGSDALSPRLIPYFVLTMLGILGIVLILQSFRKSKTETQDKAVSDQSEEGKGETSFRDLMIFIGVCIFILLTAEFLGYTFAAIIALIATLIAFKVKPLYKVIIIGVIVPILIELLYRALEIYLPLGFWENIFY